MFYICSIKIFCFSLFTAKMIDITDKNGLNVLNNKHYEKIQINY